MNRTTPHPIDALLIVALLALEAAAVLVAALVALLLTAARWRPSLWAPCTFDQITHPGEAESPDRVMPAPPPSGGVLNAAALAPNLEPLTVAQLRRRARAAGLPRALAHAGRRAELLTALAGLEVAVCC